MSGAAIPPAAGRRLDVLLGPTNFAGQPLLLAHALSERGHRARHLRYAWGRDDAPRARDGDRVVELDRRHWLERQLRVLDEVVAERPDVVHLWQRSLVQPPRGYGPFAGLDLPALKAAGARVVHRFTGYDLRLPSVDRVVNPYSPFRRGFALPWTEEAQRRHLDRLRRWVDAFVVQDPEMHAFLPEAEVIPRGVDLDALPFVGVGDRTRPLVVHAASDRRLKGTAEVLRAVAALRARGLRFDFKLVERVDHAEALAWYRRADVLVDQLLIGWYGVLAVEGMALGKPVVAYVRPELAGRLGRPLPVVPATVHDLADRLERLLLDPALREELGRRGRRFAEEVHDVRRVAVATEALYRRLLAEPPARVERPSRALLGLARGRAGRLVATGAGAVELAAFARRQPSAAASLAARRLRCGDGG